MSEEQNQTIQERLNRIEADIEDIFDSLQGICDGLRSLSEIRWPTCPPNCFSRYHEPREGERRRGKTKATSKKRGAKGGSRGSK